MKPWRNWSCMIQVERHWWANSLCWRGIVKRNFVHTNVVHIGYPQTILYKLTLKFHNWIFHCPKRMAVIQIHSWLFPLQHLFYCHYYLLLMFIYLKNNIPFDKTLDWHDFTILIYDKNIKNNQNLDPLCTFNYLRYFV